MHDGERDRTLFLIDVQKVRTDNGIERSRLLCSCSDSLMIERRILLSAFCQAPFIQGFVVLHRRFNDLLLNAGIVASDTLPIPLREDRLRLTIDLVADRFDVLRFGNVAQTERLPAGQVRRFVAETQKLAGDFFVFIRMPFGELRQYLARRFLIPDPVRVSHIFRKHGVEDHASYCCVCHILTCDDQFTGDLAAGHTVVPVRRQDLETRVQFPYFRAVIVREDPVSSLS